MSNLYDAKVPTELKKTQIWFGSIISRAIDSNSRMDPISPTGRTMEEEAAEYICPSPFLRPAQRIEIYNQQYWWRLLNSLQESFPLVTRLFGYHDFNFLIGVPYLLKYPPDTWTLNTLGDLLPQWIEESYTAKDKRLVYNSSLLDSSFIKSFVSQKNKPLDASQISEGNLNSLLDLPLFLQPHLQLFELPYDLFSFRVDFLKESPEYWLDHDFPEFAKDRTYYYVLFRDLQNEVCWVEMKPAEFSLLKQFQKGSTISQACEWLETQDEATIEEASKNLHRWFKEWAVCQWLCSSSS